MPLNIITAQEISEIWCVIYLIIFVYMWYVLSFGITFFTIVKNLPRGMKLSFIFLIVKVLTVISLSDSSPSFFIYFIIYNLIMSSFDKDSKRAFVRYISVKIKHLNAVQYIFEIANYSTQMCKSRDLLCFRIFFL